MCLYVRKHKNKKINIETDWFCSVCYFLVRKYIKKCRHFNVKVRKWTSENQQLYNGSARQQQTMNKPENVPIATLSGIASLTESK